MCSSSNNNSRKRKRKNKLSLAKRLHTKFIEEEKNYDDYLEQYCALERDETTHPIFLCSTKEYKLLKENTIVVGNPNIRNQNKTSRIIFYNILSIGKNIKYKKRGGDMTINFYNTKKRSIYVMVHKKYLENFGKVKIHKYSNGNQRGRNPMKEKYAVLLVASLSEEKCEDENYYFDKKFVQNIKRILPNQIRNQGSKHHQSEGWIYSVGYAAKYDRIGIDNMSFKKYVKSKYDDTH